MKKIIKFSKPLGKIISIKKDFFDNNLQNLKNSYKINKKYRNQKRRKFCKLCNSQLNNFDFINHNVKYIFCKKCNHLNGYYEDSFNFVNWLYKKNSGKNYSKNYEKDFSIRVKEIYDPKVIFLKSIIKKNFSILDVGSGAGHFIKSCEKKNIYGQGIEPNKILCDIGNKKLNKNKILNIELNDAYKIIKSSKKDCMSLIGVLEHVENPNAIFKSFKNSKIKFLYISVPLFSLTTILENVFPNVFPRLLSGGHTHLFTKKSLLTLIRKFNLKIVGEWWFGLDISDLFRSLKVETNISKINDYLDKSLMPHLDELQKVLDKNKLCNEVHLVLKK